jgi:hypothetical protein
VFKEVKNMSEIKNSIEFEYQPWKKIIVHEVIKLPLQHFLSSASLNVPAGGVGRPLRWVNGLIIEIQWLRETDDIIKEKLNGTIHYSALSYAVHENHQPEFKVSGNIRIPLVDVSGNKVFAELASWIKKEFETQNEQE